MPDSVVMRISLRYDGLLLSASGSKPHVENKNAIRYALSEQLEKALVRADFSGFAEQCLIDQEDDGSRRLRRSARKLNVAGSFLSC